MRLAARNVRCGFATGAPASYDRFMLAATSFITRGSLVYALLSAVAAAAVAAPPKSTPANPLGNAPDGAETNEATPAPDMPDRGTVATSPIGTRREGDYGGVKPGVAASHDSRRSGKPARKGALSWIGFEPKGSGADVFLQSAGAFEVAQHVEGGVLVIHLSGLSQLDQNTWRYIDTRYFDTSIARIVAKRVGAARASKASPGHGSGVEIRVSFKRSADAHEATVRSATEADGLYYAYLTFPGS